MRVTLVALAALARSSSAHAEPESHEPPAAEALFRAGRELVAAGRYDEGCPKFQASFELFPSVGTLLNIARCHEHDGKLVTARAEYAHALVLVRDVKDPQRQKALDDLARQAMTAIEARLPRLRAAIALPPPGLKVTCDGEDLSTTEAVAVDPGRHGVIASAPGYRTVTRTVTLEEGKVTAVEMELVPESQPESQPEARRGWLRPAGIAFAAAGAVGLGVGAVAGILSLDKVNAVKASCGGSVCLGTDQADKSAVSRALTLGNVSTAGFVAGGILGAAGVVLLVLPPGGEQKPAVRAVVGPGHLAIQGRF